MCVSVPGGMCVCVRILECLFLNLRKFDVIGRWKDHTLRYFMDAIRERVVVYWQEMLLTNYRFSKSENHKYTQSPRVDTHIRRSCGRARHGQDGDGEVTPLAELQHQAEAAKQRHCEAGRNAATPGYGAWRSWSRRMACYSLCDYVKFWMLLYLNGRLIRIWEHLKNKHITQVA